jgi:hypothetical protein
MFTEPTKEFKQARITRVLRLVEFLDDISTHHCLPRSSNGTSELLPPQRSTILE